MDEIEQKNAVSDLQKRSALYHTVAIVLSGCVLWFGLGKNAFSFSIIMTLMVGLITLVSVIRYTLICRDKVLGGIMSYFQSVAFSLRFYFLSGLLLTLVAFLFHYYHKDYIADFYSVFEALYAEVQNAGQVVFYSPEEMAMIKELQINMTPYQRALNLWFSYMFFGMFTSLIYSLFLQRKENDKLKQ